MDQPSFLDCRGGTSSLPDVGFGHLLHHSGVYV